VACAGWVLIYDYRDEKQEILDGAFADDDLDPDVAADKIEILTRMISLSRVPIEMIREAERMLNGQSDQLPRLGFSAQLTSSIICHAMLDMIFERPVRRVISVDLASVSRPSATTLKLAGRRLVELYGLRRRLRARRRNGRVGVYTPLEDVAFKQLRPYMESRTYETGSVIIRQGDPADEFFVIVDGRVHVEHEEHPELDSGDPSIQPSYTVIAELGPGDYFGEIALLNNTSRGASVVVTERCEVLVLSRGAFEIYLEESHHAAVRVASAALSRRQANELLGA
ncbi:MAG: cyclic nucleotide-binding domain-containing protein, partial [Chloroflexota bacterium]